MNTGAAIVIYFVLPSVFSLLFNLVDVLRDAAPRVDPGTSQQPLVDHSVAGEDWLQLLVTTTAWIVLLRVVGTIRLMRREVK